MQIIQIAMIAIIGAILAILLKKQNPEYALIISIGVSLIIFFMILPYFASAFELFSGLSSLVDKNNV